MTPENCEIRLKSGEIDDGSVLVNLLYILARDHMAIGDIEAMINKALSHKQDRMQYCNGWLAQWAQYEVSRLNG